MSIFHGKRREGTVGFRTLSQLTAEPIVYRKNPGPPASDAPTENQMGYLETIADIIDSGREVRFSNLAKLCGGVTPATAGKVVCHLRFLGLVGPTKPVTLTEKGRELLRRSRRKTAR